MDSETVNLIELTLLTFGSGIIGMMLGTTMRQKKASNPNTSIMQTQEELTVLSSSQLELVEHILQHMTSNMEFLLADIEESLIKLECMHDLKSERAQFLQRRYGLSADKLETYFEKNHFQFNISRITSSYTQLVAISSTFRFRKSISAYKSDQFSVEKVMVHLENDLRELLSTPCFRQIGSDAIFVDNQITNNCALIGHEEIFRQSLVSVFEVMALHVCETLSTLKQTSSKHIINLQLSDGDDSLKVRIKSDITPLQHFCRFQSKTDPESTKKDSIKVVSAITGLIKLRQHFQADLDIYLINNTFQLVFDFPLAHSKHQSLSSQDQPHNEAYETPLTQDFMASLSDDVEVINLKDHQKKKDMTLH